MLIELHQNSEGHFDYSIYTDEDALAEQVCLDGGIFTEGTAKEALEGAMNHAIELLAEHPDLIS